MNYLLGLDALGNRIRDLGMPNILEFATLEARLLENLETEHKYGNSPLTLQDRARIIDELNKYALVNVNKTFNEICINLSKTLPRQIPGASYVRCFASLPSQGYETLFRSLKEIFESPPFFWEVVRANDRYLGETIGGSIAQHIARSTCCLVEISDGDFDVGIELGMMKMYPDKSIILFRKSDSGKEYKGISGHISVIYPSDYLRDISKLVPALRQEISKREDIYLIRGLHHFLSPTLMGVDWITEDLAMKLSKTYHTIEEFLAKDPEIVRQKIGIPHAGLIRDIQFYLEQNFLS